MNSCVLLLSCLLLVSLLTQNGKANEFTHKREKQKVMSGTIGALVDCSSRIGKERKVAMEMAINDFNSKFNRSFALQLQDFHGQPFQAALAAKELVDGHKVQAIVGPEGWEETKLVADITSSQANIPIISLADTSPKWATDQWPLMIQASPSQQLQMKAIAAIVQSWEWHQVTIIYEDDDSSMAGSLPFLLHSLKERGAEAKNLVPFSPSASLMMEQLNKIKQDHCRVFLVHLSLPLATNLFEMANRMEMEEGYVWITTSSFTNLIHSINSSSLSSMQGVVGVRSYFADKNFPNFDKIFRLKFSSEYGDAEENHEPGIYALQAYDAIWTICFAMEGSSKKGEDLFNEILKSDFEGVSGKIQFVDKRLADSDKFEVINVVGRKGYREVGFWSDGSGLGFPKNLDERAKYNSSMKSLGNIFWPGALWGSPRGWAITNNNEKRLKIAVPSISSFKQYVNVTCDPVNHKCSFEGLAIDLFKAITKSLPYSLPYEFFPFNESYDELVEQIHQKNFDAVVGDVAIVEERYEHAEFTHPYTEPGLVLIVPAKQPQTSKRGLLFLKPFTTTMWVLILVINIYNGFVVWLIEKNYCLELKGSVLTQMGIWIWLSFTTLFSLQGNKLHSNLSRMVMVMWLFVALVITQTYTANFASILTVKRLEPVANIQSLRNSNETVGYCKGAFVSRYLLNVLNFRPKRIKHYNSPEEFAQALKSGEIAAAFLEVPLAKLFLAKYCKEFIVAGPTYRIGGFGYVFPKGSPLSHDVTKALLRILEEGKLNEMEKSMLGSEKCVDLNDQSDGEISSLSPSSFWVLFILSGGTSTIALSIYLIFHTTKSSHFGDNFSFLFSLLIQVMKRTKQLHRRDSDVESPPNNSAGV